jgi:cell wall-associated NlpC family hydrolase
MKWYADYVGIPFKTLGRDRSGCDCYGLARLVLQDKYNIELPDLLTYTNAKDVNQTSVVISENMPLLTGERLELPKEGSIVVLRARKEQRSAHVGLMVTDSLMLHTTYSTGALIEPVNTPNIKNRIKGIYNVDKSYYTS